MTFARFIAFVRGIARRGRIRAEVDEELRFHVEQEIEAHVARGVPPAEARRMALRDLGGLTATTQAVREVRAIVVDLLWRDTVYAVRSLRATPSFTLVALAGGFLFEIKPHDPTIYAGVAAVLAVAGLTAAVIPARRAASVDPLIALRME